MTREQNRQRMPIAASYMDALSAFAPRMIWWSENGHNVGKQSTGEHK